MLKIRMSLNLLMPCFKSPADGEADETPRVKGCNELCTFGFYMMYVNVMVVTALLCTDQKWNGTIPTTCVCQYAIRINAIRFSFCVYI